MIWSDELPSHATAPTQQEKGIYDEGDIMKAKLALLRNTNMVDFAMDIHKSLYEGSPIPQAMKERRAEVVARLRQLQQDVDPIIKCLENPNVVRNFRQDKTFNMQVMARKAGRSQDQLQCACMRGAWSHHTALHALHLLALDIDSTNRALGMGMWTALS